MAYIYIEVDTNDADYVGGIQKIITEDIEIIKSFIPKLQAQEGHFEWGECQRISPKELYPDVDPEVLAVFEEHLPRTEYGFHTIVEIKLFTCEPEVLYN